MPTPTPEYERLGSWAGGPGAPAVVVHRLATYPEWRGRGVAAALMAQAERVAAGLGIRFVRVDTNSENAATQQLFPKLGFSYVGEIALDFRPGLRFVCYEKALDYLGQPAWRGAAPSPGGGAAAR